MTTLAAVDPTMRMPTAKPIHCRVKVASMRS